MPFARLTLFPTPSPEAAHRLATGLTDIIARDLSKRHELTSVIIETPSGFHWTIGAKKITAGAHLEVCVTAGTNSENEKRSFLSSAMSLMREIEPDLHAATYVIVKELSASDWGFDGLTQADRLNQATFSRD